MARGSAAMGVSICGVMLMMMIMGAAAQAPAPAPDCGTVVLTLSDCLTYVTGSDKTPSAACCSELKSVIDNTPQCLCILFNKTFTDPLGVNVTLAQQLPPACKLQTPPTSLCSLFGIPVPGPVSPAASSPAVTPATDTAPSAAPASGPAATDAEASSPSAMTAPAGSGPASSPSTGTAPPSTSTTAPPNSAPSITSQNAAVVVSLLFLASIFLS